MKERKKKNNFKNLLSGHRNYVCDSSFSEIPWIIFLERGICGLNMVNLRLQFVKDKSLVEGRAAI